MQIQLQPIEPLTFAPKKQVSIKMMDTLKVLLANGSLRKDEGVHTALSEITDTLKSEGIESAIFWVGNQPVARCIGCGVCVEKRSCFQNFKINEFVKLIDEFDDFVFGTPLHYAATSGAMTSFLNRIFMIEECNGDHFAGKPAAAAVLRRYLTK